MPENNQHQDNDTEIFERNDILVSVKPTERSAFCALVQDFSPIWFTWSMNTGVIGTLLHELPYQFRGQQVISTVVFTYGLVLYVFFSVVYILRFAIFRKIAFNELIGNVLDICLLPCWAIAWMVMISFVSLTVSHATWGGYQFTIVAYVMWWIAAAWMFSMLFFAFIVLIQRHDILDRQLPTLIIIPAVGLSTLALVGGVVTSFSNGISSRLAVPIIIMSTCALGVGILLGMILYTYLFHQLLAKGWPPASQTATLFMLVGPMGQSAAALQLLGSAANTRKHFWNYNQSTFINPTAAVSLEITCILLALLMTGLGAVWLAFAIFAMIERAYDRELGWEVTWNAIIFPTGTLATSTLLLGHSLDSAFFRVVTAIIVILLSLVFFVNTGFTFWRIYKGDLLIVRKNPRIEEQFKAN